MQSPPTSLTPTQPAVSPLDQLADIHLPDSVSWWPIAPGWWILLTLLIITLIGCFIWHRRKQQNYYRVIAQQELAAIYTQYQQTQDAAAYLHSLSVILRRTAITAYPHTFNASIKGTDWLNWLDAVCPANNEKFSGSVGHYLLSSAYQKNPQVDAAALYQLSEQWIKLHCNHRQKIPAAKKVIPTVEAKHV